MQIRHSLLYLLANVITAGAAFLTLAVYTRWISTADYGLYSTLTVLVSGANAILFNWLYGGILRYWNDERTRPEILQGVVLMAIAALSLVIILFAILYSTLLGGSPVLAAAFCLLLISGALFAAIQRIHAIAIQPNCYLRNEITRVLFSTILGIYLVWQGYSWYGIIISTGLGFILVPLIFNSSRRFFWQHSLSMDSGLLLELVRYGLPLSATFMLLEIIHASDRVLLGKLAGMAVTGQYAVAFSLPFQILVMVASAVNMALYPHIMHSLEHEGRVVCEQRLSRYLLLLLGVLLPVWGGMVAVAEDFLPLLIGEDFLPAAIHLLPLAGLAVTLSCIYMFHTSLAFQLGKKTMPTIAVTGGAALLNIVLNVWWIPEFGMEGALYASVLAYLFSVVVGHWLGRRCFTLPVPVTDVLKLLLATGCMVLLLDWLPLGHGLGAGLLRVFWGALCYSACLIVLNVGAVRGYLYALWVQLNLQTPSR